MSNFAPPTYYPDVFITPPDGCAVCAARIELDEGLERHEEALEIYSQCLDNLPSTSPRLNQADRLRLGRQFRQYNRAFSRMVTIYYALMVSNKWIYFTLEQYGRLAETPELVPAYDGFRAHAGRTLETMRQDFENLGLANNALEHSPTGEAFNVLVEDYNRLNAWVNSFWEALDTYAQGTEDAPGWLPRAANLF